MAVDTHQTLIDQIAPYAVASQQKTGIPASVTIAQFIQESGWTLSTLASKFNNFFGIKGSSTDGTSVWMPTTEYVNGKRSVSVEPFKQYASPMDSFTDHASVLNRLGVSGSDPYAVADQLQAAGYATDPNYANALKGIIKENNLTKYDSGGGFWSNIWDNTGGALGNAIRGTISGNPNPDLTRDPQTDKIVVNNHDGTTSPVGYSSLSGVSGAAYVGVVILIILVMVFAGFMMLK